MTTDSEAYTSSYWIVVMRLTQKALHSEHGLISATAYVHFDCN